VNQAQRATDGFTASETVWWDSNGDKHIRRPARDDSWF
jgi:hypothetical protein